MHVLSLTFIPPWAVLGASQLIVSAHLSLHLCKALRIISEILGSVRRRRRGHGGCPAASMMGGAIGGAQAAVA